MSDKKFSQVQIGDVVPGERSGWFTVAAKTERNGIVRLSGTDIDTGATRSTWDTADADIEVMES
jgi:hypothetical protein